MSRHKAIAKQELERVLEYLRLGFTVRLAAESIERSAGAIYVALNSEEWKERYEEAKTVGHDARADRMREAILVHAEGGNTKALEIGSRWVPELRDAKQQVEITGAMEVTHPDVAAAIERFTARVVSLAAGQREGEPVGIPATTGEGAARVPVAELDSPAEPGGPTG